MVEVNSETDFVARNERFQDMVRTIASLAPKADGDLEKLLGSTYPGKSMTVADYVKEMVATIGENMSVRRTVGAWRSATVTLPSTCTTRLPTDWARSACWWRSRARATRRRLRASAGSCACTSPRRAPPPSPPRTSTPSSIERERAVYTEQAKASGKSAEIAAKMVEGRLRKEFFQQVVLLQQTFLGAGRRRQGNRRAGAQGGGEDGRRTHQDRQVRPLCAGRGHRQEGRRFRRPRWPRPPASGEPPKGSNGANTRAAAVSPSRRLPTGRHSV